MKTLKPPAPTKAKAAVTDLAGEKGRKGERENSPPLSFSPAPLPAPAPPPVLPALLARTGPLTADLVQRPGDFGLGNVPARLVPDATTTTVCGFCSTGCGLQVHLRDGQAINLSADGQYPVNLGMACPKGWEALTPLAAPDRATTPLLRNAATGALDPIDWDYALQLFTLKFKALVEQHGPESIAFLSTGQICTEEMALLGALFRFGMGGVHCDSNTRQCMATSHVAYKQSFGFDAPPFTYADFEESDVLVFIGSNVCIAHPILWQRVLRNRKQPEIIIIDPRKTETAMNATQHLALTPKSDLTLLYGLANLLAQGGWIDRAFIERSTAGFDEFASFIRSFTPDKVAAETGVTVGELFRCAESIGRGKAVSFWWTMGVNQGHESTRTAQAIINLALMTGNIGRPGTGANSITGQCNAMGSRLFANATGLLGGRDFVNPDHRAEVARILNLPLDRIPAANSLAYDQIIERIRDGRIKGLWVIGTNPSHSWIGRGLHESQAATEQSPARSAELPPGARRAGARRSNHAGGSHDELERALDQLEFLVVQDMYHSTETAQRAHLILPAAGWGEKDGTFINSERRIGVAKKVTRAPGEALADFYIFRLVAHYWGCGQLFREWTSPQATFQILKRLSAGRPCDFTGIEDYRHLEKCGGIQWPMRRASHSGFSVQDSETETAQPGGVRPSPGAEVSERKATSERSSALEFSRVAAPGDGRTPIQDGHSLGTDQSSRERRLFADGRFFTPDGKARFIFEAPRPLPEQTDAEFPLILLTGRSSSAQWHTLTRTAKSDILQRLSPQALFLEMHPDDAQQLGVRPNGLVRIISRRGEIEARASITAAVQRGQVFLPMHDPATNCLTLPVFDPHSRQPGYKFCAVRVLPVRSRR